jgi:hypothetical protein
MCFDLPAGLPLLSVGAGSAGVHDLAAYGGVRREYAKISSEMLLGGAEREPQDAR